MRTPRTLILMPKGIQNGVTFDVNTHHIFIKKKTGKQNHEHRNCPVSLNGNIIHIQSNKNKVDLRFRRLTRKRKKVSDNN